MSNAERTRARTARERIAHQQATARRAEIRRRVFIAGGSTLVVLALVIGLIVAKVSQSPAPAAGSAAAPAVARQVTTVPAATFDTVAAGTSASLKATSGQPLLTRGGKPELLYMGGQYCPFCAAERWAIAAAVSRFGTLSGLHFIHSSPTDYAPNTPTLSFDKAHFSSKYLSFVPVEWYGEQQDPSTPFGHVLFQHPTAQEQALFNRYAGGSFPFVDVGNQFLAPGAQYAPTALAGMTWAQVAAAMRNPSSAVGKDIDGSANKITAAICKLTHGQPGGVCMSAGVRAADGSV